MQSIAATIRAALTRIESRGTSRYQIVQAINASRGDGEPQLTLTMLRKFIEGGELRTDTASKLAAYCGLEMRKKKLAEREGK